MNMYAFQTAIAKRKSMEVDRMKFERLLTTTLVNMWSSKPVKPEQLISFYDDHVVAKGYWGTELTKQQFEKASAEMDKHQRIMIETGQRPRVRD